MRYESLPERLIREAMERGEFDNLPGAGKPLHLVQEEDWWVKSKLRAENLSMPLPAPLALRREVDRIQETLADVRKEDDARSLCEDVNARIKDSYRRGDSPRVVIRLLDVDAELERWRGRHRPPSSPGGR